MLSEADSDQKIEKTSTKLRSERFKANGTNPLREDLPSALRNTDSRPVSRFVSSEKLLLTKPLKPTNRHPVKES